MASALAARTGAAVKRVSSAEFGTSGIEFFNGFVNDPSEYKGTFRDLRTALREYEKIRRSDPTTAACLGAIELMVGGAEWTVKPPKDPNAVEQDAAEHGQRVLFSFPSAPWSHTIHHVSGTMSWAGFAILEAVYALDDDGRVVVRRFAPRLPHSISKWNWNDADGRLDSIEQDVMGPNGRAPKPIPRDHLIHFILLPWGDDPRGLSPMRPVYKPGWLKGEYERIDGVAYERQGVGIPEATVPDNAQADTIREAESICQSVRANEQGFIVHKESIKFNMVDMKSEGTKDCDAAIRRCDEQIARAFQAAVLMLGTTASGSRALGAELGEMFLLSIEAHHKAIADPLNALLARLTLWNFGPGVRPPTLIATSPYHRRDPESMARLYAILRNVGFPLGANDAAHVRKLAVLPEDPGEPIAPRPVATFPGAPAPEMPPGAKKPTADDDKGDDEGKEAKPQDGEKGEHEDDAPEAHTHGACGHATPYRYGAERRFRRDLTKWEHAVGLRQLEAAMDDAVETAEGATAAIRAAAVKDLAGDISRIVAAGAAGDLKQIALAPATRAALEEQVRAVLFDLYLFGRSTVRGELDRLGLSKAGATALAFDDDDRDKRINDLLGSEADRVTTEIVNRVEGSAKELATGEMRTKGAGLSKVGAAIAKAAQQAVRTAVGRTVSGALNTGRDVEMRVAAEAGIAEKVQLSSVLDENSCDVCIEQDGSETTIGSSEYAVLTPPLNECKGKGYCRCIQVIVGEEDVSLLPPRDGDVE